MSEVDQIGFFADGPAAIAKAKIATQAAQIEAQDARIAELERQKNGALEALKKLHRAVNYRAACVTSGNDTTQADEVMWAAMDNGKMVLDAALAAVGEKK